MLELVLALAAEQVSAIVNLRKSWTSWRKSRLEGRRPRRGRVCQCTGCRGPDSWLRRTESASRGPPQARNRPRQRGMVRRHGDEQSLLPGPRLLTSGKRCQLKEM